MPAQTKCLFFYVSCSLDEMAKYDLPAMVDFILKTTGHKQISYVGHSQGTTIAFAGLSISKDLQSKINLFVALAPVVYTAHMTSPLHDFAQPSMYQPIFVSVLDAQVSIFTTHEDFIFNLFFF